MRYVIDVRYDGTNYSGWQAQDNAVSVQSVLDKALELLLRHPVIIYGAGRTDAGVHAIQMPAHFDHEGELHPHFLRAINAILPTAIAVTRVYPAPSEDFHARFSAKSRAYRYQLIFTKNPHLYHFSFLLAARRGCGGHATWRGHHQGIRLV
jgi:tRNA pseudouridine38-40 synthase